MAFVGDFWLTGLRTCEVHLDTGALSSVVKEAVNSISYLLFDDSKPVESRVQVILWVGSVSLLI